MDYKEEQRKTRARLRSVRELHSGKTTLNLGIKQFKRDNPNRKDAHAIYKTNVWKTLVK